MLANKDLIGKKLLIQISKDHTPEVWTVSDVRDSYFGRFVEFRTCENKTIIAKIDSLYTVKFI